MSPERPLKFGGSRKALRSCTFGVFVFKGGAPVFLFAVVTSFGDNTGMVQLLMPAP